MATEEAKYVVLINANGEEVARHRTDRMNFDAFTWVFAQEQERHGPLTYRIESVSEEAERSIRT